MNSGESQPSSPAPKRPKKRRRILLFSLLALGLILFFAPQWAPAVAGGWIAGTLGDSVEGEASLEGVSLSWGGPLQIDRLRVESDRGDLLADVSVELSKGLWAWIFDQKDLGTIKLSGRVESELQAAENAEPVPETPPSDGTEEDLVLPSGLKGRFLLEGLELAIRDRRQSDAPQDYTVENLRGEFELAIPEGEPGRTSGELQAGFRVANADQGGSMKLSLQAEPLTGSDHVLRIEDVTAQLDLQLQGLPVGLLDSMMAQEGALIQALGESADMRLALDTAKMNGTARLGLQSLQGQAALNLKLSPEGFELVEPGQVELASSQFLASLPATRESLASASAGIELEQSPALHLSVDRLSLPYDMQSSTLQMEGIAFDLGFRAEAFGGRLQVESSSGTTNQAFELTPFELRLQSDRLGDGVRMLASTEATLDGQSAGVLRADMNVGGFLESTGEEASGLPVMKGELRLERFATAVLQPLLAGMDAPLDLQRDLGPEVQLICSADVDGETTAASPGRIDLSLSARNARMTGKLALADGWLKTRDQGIELHIDSTSALVRDALAGDGASTMQAEGLGTLDFRIPRLEWPLDNPEAGMNQLIAEVQLRVSDLRLQTVDEFGAPAFRSEDLLGRDLSLSLSMGPDENESATSTWTGMFSAGEMTARTNGRVNAQELHMDTLMADLRLDPTWVNPLLAQYMPKDAEQPGPDPRLGQPVDLQLRAPPIRLPMKADGGGFDWATAGVSRFELSAPGAIRVDDLSLGTQLVSAQLQELKAHADLPWAMFEENAQQDLSLEFGAALHDAANVLLARLQGSAELRADGAMVIDAKLHETDNAALDQWLGQPELLTGGLGPQLALSLGAQQSATGDQLDLSLGLDSQQLQLANLQLQKDGPVLRLKNPVQADWQFDEDWADRYLMQPETPQSPRLIGVTGVKLSLDRLALALPPSSEEDPATESEAAPAVGDLPFEVDGRLRFQRLNLSSDDQLIVLVGTEMSIRSEEPHGSLRLLADSEEAVLEADRVSRPKPLNLDARLGGLVDDRGYLSAENMTWTAQGGLNSFSTAVIDALSTRNGLLPEFLGKDLSLDFQAVELSGESGSFQATAQAPNANAEVSGRIQDGMFQADKPVRIELNALNSKACEMLVGGVSLVGSFEKRPGDGTALLTADNLNVPLDGDLTKLNGTLTLDAGKALVKISPMFQQLLDAAGGKIGEQYLASMEPIQMTITNGRLKYDRFTLPLGDRHFLKLQGSVNLAKQRANIITWVPLSSLNKRWEKSFQSAVSGPLSALGGKREGPTLVPFRFRGDLAGIAPQPDVELFVKELGSDLLSPENALEGLGRGLLDGLNKPKNDEPKKPRRPKKPKKP